MYSPDIKICVGQRWKFYNYGVVEITKIPTDLQCYSANTVQSIHGWTYVGYTWDKLPCWHDNKPLNGWVYLEGQDRPI